METVSDVRFRPASVEDAWAVARVQNAAWLETYKGLVPDELLASLTDEVRAHQWQAILADPNKFKSIAVYVVERDDELIGFGQACRQRFDGLLNQGYDGEISGIYLLKRAQGRGYGRRLFETVIDALAADGCKAVSLWVLRENTQARKFYEHLGGRALSEQQEENVPGGVITEVAYGWDRLPVTGRRLLDTGPVAV